MGWETQGSRSSKMHVYDDHLFLGYDFHDRCWFWYTTPTFVIHDIPQQIKGVERAKQFAIVAANVIG